jgi:hypothetical protein
MMSLLGFLHACRVTDVIVSRPGGADTAPM